MQRNCVKPRTVTPDAPSRPGLVRHLRCDNAILAHERLSIVDVMRRPANNARKTHVLAVNGEIYNHQTLRAEYGDRYAFPDRLRLGLFSLSGKGPDFLDDLRGCSPSPCDSEKDAYLIGRDRYRYYSALYGL